jgi:hypothetical protein
VFIIYIYALLKIPGKSRVVNVHNADMAMYRYSSTPCSRRALVLQRLMLSSWSTPQINCCLLKSPSLQKTVTLLSSGSRSMKDMHSRLNAWRGHKEGENVQVLRSSIAMFWSCADSSSITMKRWCTHDV